MSDQGVKPLVQIGRVELLDFPELNVSIVPARIDTGAKTSALWVSGVREANGELEYQLFDANSEFFTGEIIKTKDFSKILVSTSTGEVQERYVVRHLVVLADRKIRASFTLANRENQAYPILVGRNVLRGKFVVDVKQGVPQLRREQEKEQYKRSVHQTTQQSDNQQEAKQ